MTFPAIPEELFGVSVSKFPFAEAELSVWGASSPQTDSSAVLPIQIPKKVLC